jgi:hypothetical protein
MKVATNLVAMILKKVNQRVGLRDTEATPIKLNSPLAQKLIPPSIQKKYCLQITRKLFTIHILKKINPSKIV